ncbi:MAG: hypothetical protein RMJ81_09295 [Candidatus Kryptonium sp.]|nr:hypothetical protein [Candidatus Kryptonium sp.]MCX7762382.1 hypothetical protein [Candidatus Kryptonium sp.]MDW8109829.1 hypothetical protein [Candidatus Kryptonium sp.]
MAKKTQKSAKEKSKKKGSARGTKKFKELSEKSIEILPVIEYAIYEVDKIFQNQGDRLTDEYLVSSLKELTHLIKAKSFETLLEEMREELTEDSDIIHWNIISRIGEYIEENELNYSGRDIVSALDELINTIKIQMSKQDPRAYLSFLAEIMRGVEIKGARRSDRDMDIQRDIDEDYFDEEENY